MFQHIVYTRLGESTGVGHVCYRTCKTRFDTTTKIMVVLTLLFNLVISSFPDNMFYTCMNMAVDLSTIYHDGSNNVVQVCSFIKPWTVCSNMHEQACQQHCSSWPAQPCSIWPAQPCSIWPVQSCSIWPAQPYSSLSTSLNMMKTSCAFWRV